MPSLAHLLTIVISTVNFPALYSWKEGSVATRIDKDLEAQAPVEVPTAKDQEQDAAFEELEFDRELLGDFLTLAHRS